MLQRQRPVHTISMMLRGIQLQGFKNHWRYIVGGALALYLTWVLAAPASTTRGLIGASLVFACRLLLAILILRLAKRRLPLGWGRVWRYLAIGACFWAAADGIELAARLLEGRLPPPPSLASWIRLAGHLAALSAVTSHPALENQRLGRIRDLLDNGIISLSVLTIAWLVVLRAALKIGLAGTIELLWTGLAPALDLVVFSLLVKLLAQSDDRRDRQLFSLLAAGMLLLGLSDWAHGYLRLQGEGLGGTLVEPGLMAGTLLLAAATAAWYSVPTEPEYGHERGEFWERLGSRLEPLLPIGFTYAVVGMTALDWWLTGEVDQIAIAAAATLSVLLVARQGAILGQTELRNAFEQVESARSQLQALNLALEEKVSERTRELEATVADLARLNEELQELDRLKSEFVALVSHELRAPLTNIRGGMELLLKSESQLNGNVQEKLSLIHAESERLSHFIETILDLSALEAGRFPLRLLAIPLKDTATEVSARFPEELKKKRLKVDIPADLPLISADERGLSSVLFHLLDNAFKYAPKGEIRVEAKAENGLVQVMVIDQGPGIPADEQERVFDMFHRLDSRDSRETYGHGLGLHMAKRLLQAMGGGIRAEHNPGGSGARFVFWLPQAKATEKGSGSLATSMEGSPRQH